MASPRRVGIDDIRRGLEGAPSPRVISAATGDVSILESVAEQAIQAAVLVALIDHEGVPSVLLHERAHDLKRHPGQVGFSGGIIEPIDTDAAACALRETEEEIGLSRSRVQVFSVLDRCMTGTGYCVTPIVGRVEPGFTLTPDPREVVDVFEVPLSFVLDPANHTQGSLDMPDGVFHFYDIRWNGRRIWGATARMIVNLYERAGVG